MKKRKWRYKSDENLLDACGSNDMGLDIRWLGDRKFQFIELLDMNSLCGSENDGQPRYCCEVSYVDIDELPPEQLESAKQCSGFDGSEDWHNEPDALAECVKQYGAVALLWSESDGDWRRLQRNARRAANNLLDESAFEAAMDRPVNRIGSTAREYMKGDIDSAMRRGVEAGKPEARVMAKIHGVPQAVIDDVRPDDFLPYAMGYMDAMGGHEKKIDDGSIAKEYFRGYERGENVKAGKCPPPSWITIPKKAG